MGWDFLDEKEILMFLELYGFCFGLLEKECVNFEDNEVTKVD